MNKSLVSEIENHIGADIDSLLPTEFLLDETHPNNQSFLQTLKKIDAEIRGLTYGLTGKEIQSSIMAYRGDSPAEIAAAIKITRQTVYKWRKKTVFKKLIALYAYREQFSATPTQAMKENLLWEVANKNKNMNPSVAVAAVRELNNMETVRHEREDRLKGLMGTQTSIIINPQTMPKTALDQLPTTVEGEFTEAKK